MRLIFKLFSSSRFESQTLGREEAGTQGIPGPAARVRGALVLLQSNWRVIGFCLVYKADNRSANLISSVGLKGHQLPVRRSSATLPRAAAGELPEA